MNLILRALFSCMLCVMLCIGNLISAIDLVNYDDANLESWEDLSENEFADQVLLKNGFSEDIISKLSEHTKMSIANQLSGENEIAFEIREESVMDGFISTLAQVDEENLILIIVTEITKIEGEEVKEIKVKAYYEWVNLPIWRIQDPILISWDSEKFTYKSGSFYSEDRYSTTAAKDVLYMSRKMYHSKNNNTFRWDTNLIDILDSYEGTVTELYGFGEITLRVNEGYRYYGNSNVGVTYVHNVPIVGVGISMGVEIGFEISTLSEYYLSNDVDFSWNCPIYLAPADYGYAQQYFYYEKTVPIEIEGTTFNTAILRTGYIEEEYIVLSPRRVDAGEAYLEYTFSTDIIQMNVKLALWSENEHLLTSDATAVLQYKNADGDWTTILDMMNDIELPTDRNSPINVVISFPNEVREVRFYVSSSPIGDRNKGRVCIGDMELYLER